jgi:hypothetical protein
VYESNDLQIVFAPWCDFRQAQRRIRPDEDPSVYAQSMGEILYCLHLKRGVWTPLTQLSKKKKVDEIVKLGLSQVGDLGHSFETKEI